MTLCRMTIAPGSGHRERENPDGWTDGSSGEASAAVPVRRDNKHARTRRAGKTFRETDVIDSQD